MTLSKNEKATQRYPIMLAPVPVHTTKSPSMHPSCQIRIGSILGIMFVPGRTLQECPHGRHSSTGVYRASCLSHCSLILISTMAPTGFPLMARLLRVCRPRSLTSWSRTLFRKLQARCGTERKRTSASLSRSLIYARRVCMCMSA